MNEREYERLKKIIQDDYRKKLEALDIVWRVAVGSSPPGEKLTTAPNGGSAAGDSDEPAESRGVIMAAVEDAIYQIEGAFTVKSVAPLVMEILPGTQSPERSSISHALKRLADDGRLEVVQLGRGKRPTTYRRASPPDSDRHRAGGDGSDGAIMCNDDQKTRIRDMVRDHGFEVPEFREVVLDGIFGVSALKDMTHGQAADLISRMRKIRKPGQPIGDYFS